MGTIVQEYGPIYGEVVNGTVQGRPNGSVYVPISNSITASIPESRRYIAGREISAGTYRINICTSAGVINWNSYLAEFVALSQDLANNIRIQISDSIDFDTLISESNVTAGLFSYSTASLAILNTDPGIVADKTYYVRAVLMAGAVPVATSSPVEVVGVVIS